MERLTKRLPEDLGVVPIGGYGWPEIAAKLAQYEDAEEQGRLIVLPCKVGSAIYAPTRNFVSEFRVTQFDYCGYAEPYLWVNWYLVKGITGKYRSDGIPAVEIGKTVFLSRNEAEMALEGMR